MAKINIPFNGTDYSIDESALVSAKDSLKTHLSTVMNGEGGGLEPIIWDGVSGNVWEAMSGPIASFVKVSDRALTVSDFVGATATFASGETQQFVLGEGDVMSFTEYAQMQGGDALSQGAVASLEGISTDSSGSSSTFKMPVIMSISEVSPDEADWVSVGTYFIRFAPSNEGVTTYLQSLTFPSNSTSGDIIVTLDGTKYSVDSTKLSTATDGFVTHIGTLTGGEGGGLEPITWDGVVGDRVTTAAYGQITYVKVSDAILSADDLLGAIVSLSNGNDVLLISDYIMQATGGVVIAESMMVSVAEAEAFSESISLNFSETGTYFAYPADASLYITSITFAGGGSAGGTIKLIVNGTEYLVDSAKLSDAIAELHEALGRLQSGN